MSEKIALLGGTFNPVHNGHLMLANGFLKEIPADKLLFIPSSRPPHKTPDQLADARHRLMMCSLAVQGNPHFHVTDMEIKRGGKSYTYETVMALKKIYPEAAFYFICGADMFLTLESWYRYRELLKLIVFCCAPRDAVNFKKLREYSEKIRLLGGETLICDFPVMDISSSQIRERIKARQPVDGLLPVTVAEYIQSNRLYL